MDDMQTHSEAAFTPGFSGSRPIQFYKSLLRLYPRSFRDRFGEEILLVIEDELQGKLAEKGRATLAIFWLAAFLNLLVTAVQEHRDRSTNPLKIQSLQKVSRGLTAGIVQLLSSAVAYILIGYIYLKINTGAVGLPE
jgi:hypothetical protein